MTEKSASDELQERAAAAIKEAQSGSNHQAGADGDDDGVAVGAADDERTASSGPA